MKDGVIADFDICEKMLRYFIQRVHSRRWAKPRMVICVPSGITGVEQRAVQEAAEYAGARKPAYIIEEPMAAAIGAGLPVHEPAGNMVVDVGGGTTEVAVISLGGIVASESIRIAGDELDEAIITYVKKEYSLALGERTAEEIKVALASAYPLEEELYAEIRGRDLVTGLPKTIVVSTEEIREAVEEPVSAIVDAVKVTLDKTPPELAADIMEKGIVITGGGALLHGLDHRLHSETGMPIVVAAEPALLGRASARASASRSSTHSSKCSCPRSGADGPESEPLNRGGIPTHQSPAFRAHPPDPDLDHVDHRRRPGQQRGSDAHGAGRRARRHGPGPGGGRRHPLAGGGLVRRRDRERGPEAGEPGAAEPARRSPGRGRASRGIARREIRELRRLAELPYAPDLPASPRR